MLVTTAGGIEEDFIKCLAPSYLGDFKLKGKELRANGVNRIGNLLVPNANYCLFEDWLSPILHTMTDEQVKDKVRWSPSTMIDRLGKEINNEESVYYWAHKNGIPVYCPALTDGSIGDMLYFHSFKRPEFILDVVQDIRGINNIAVHAPCTGMYVPLHVSYLPVLSDFLSHSLLLFFSTLFFYPSLPLSFFLFSHFLYICHNSYPLIIDNLSCNILTKDSPFCLLNLFICVIT